MRSLVAARANPNLVEIVRAQETEQLTRGDLMPI
jgi:hypothetical protein